MFGIIYLLTNKKNGMQYVGQTVQEMKDRWTEHVSHARTKCSNSYISRAIFKYGSKQFSIEKVHEAQSREELNFCECFYIAFLNTKTPNGYNLSNGGDGVSGWANGKGFIPSKETRDKISKSLIGNSRSKGIKRSKEFIEKIKNALRNRKRKKSSYDKAVKSRAWYKHSEEVRKKISTGLIKKECKRGHDFSVPNNVYIHPNGKRECKVCRDMRYEIKKSRQSTK